MMMPNIKNVYLLSCENLLLSFVLNDGKIKIFGLLIRQDKQFEDIFDHYQTFCRPNDSLKSAD